MRDPEEAARALTEIGRRQEQVIDKATIPPWFWFSIAGLMVVLGVGVDSHRPLVLAAGTTIFVVGTMVVSWRVAVSRQLQAKVHNDLLGPAGVLAILSFVGLVLVVALPTAFALQAAGYGHPATAGVLAGAIVMAALGPVLGRYLRRVMLANRAGTPR
jgi:hypothetical protein